MICKVRSTTAVARPAFIRDSQGRGHGKAQFSRGFRSMNTPSGVRRENNDVIASAGSAGSCCSTMSPPGGRDGLRQIEFVMVLNVSGQSATPLGTAWISLERPRVVTGRAGRFVILGLAMTAPNRIHPIAAALYARDGPGSLGIIARTVPCTNARDSAMSRVEVISSPQRRRWSAVYFYSPHRRGEHPERHLAGYSGILQADAYAGLNVVFQTDRKLGPITKALCCRHSTRKLFELVDVASKARDKTTAVISPMAFQAVQKFDAVFALERSINGLPTNERPAARRRDVDQRPRRLEDPGTS